MEEGFIMKRLIALLIVFGFAATLSAQSVADLARKERERREALKGRRAVVVTNDDLLRITKRPAVEVSPQAAGWDIVEADEPDRIMEQEAAAGPGAVVSAPSAAEGTSRRITPRVAAPGPSLMGDPEAVDQTSTGAGPLEAQLQAAEELVDLLETKLAALKQEYEFQTSMVPNYVIEKQLNDTYQRLMKAQAQEARIRADFEKKSRERRPPAESDR
jgi:hypothetical protein